MSGTVTSSGPRPRTELRPTGTSFVGLVGIELRRLWWRRLTKAVLAGVVLFVLAMVYNAYNSSTPERLAQQLDDYSIMVEENKRQAEQMKDQLPQMIKDCEEQQALERERSDDPSIDFGCSTIGTFQTPTLEDMGIVVPIADTITESAMEPLVSVLGFLALILMGSFVAAEFTTGSMGNWLTFKPRRVQVAASKLVAAALGATLLAAGAVALLALGARMVATLNRPGSDLQLPDPPPLDESLGQLVLRAVVLVLAARCARAQPSASSSGTPPQSSASVLGYVVRRRGVRRARASLQGRLTPFAVVPNALTPSSSRGTPTRRRRAPPTGATYAEQTVSYTHGWVYLLVLAVSRSSSAWPPSGGATSPDRPDAAGPDLSIGAPAVRRRCKPDGPVGKAKEHDMAKYLDPHLRQRAGVGRADAGRARGEGRRARRVQGRGRRRLPARRRARVGDDGDDPAGRGRRHPGRDRRPLHGDARRRSAASTSSTRPTSTQPWRPPGCSPSCASSTARSRCARSSTTAEAPPWPPLRRPRSPRRSRAPTGTSGAACSPSTARVTRDLDLAEECTQDAFERALRAVAGGRHTPAAGRLADDRRGQPGP